MSKELNHESITCPDCGGHYFTIKHIPSANTYYFMCLDCYNNKDSPLKFITDELITVSSMSQTLSRTEDKK